MARSTTPSTAPPSPGTVLGGAGLLLSRGGVTGSTANFDFASSGSSPDPATTPAHLDALRTRGPDALSGERISCDDELMGGGGASLNGWPGSRGTAWLKQRHEKCRCNSGADDSGERPALSLGSGSISTRPTAVPGSSLPEFRATIPESVVEALMVALAVPAGMILASAILWIFL